MKRQRGTSLSVLAALRPPAWLGSSVRLWGILSSTLLHPALSMDAASGVHPFIGGGREGCVASSRGKQDAGEGFRGPAELGIEAVQWLESALRFWVLRVTVLESTGLTSACFRLSLERGVKLCSDVRNLAVMASFLNWSLRHSGSQFAHLSLRRFMDGYIGLARSLFELNELFGPCSMRSCLYKGLWIWKICHFVNRIG